LKLFVIDLKWYSLFRWNRAKLSEKQRKDRVRQKKEAYLKKLQAGGDE